MPISRAIELATQWVNEERSDEGGLWVERPYLARYGCRGEADYWYYVVTFSPFSLKGVDFEDVGASVAVLMDGTVIGPELAD